MDWTSPEPVDLAGPLELPDLMDQDTQMAGPSAVQNPRVVEGAGSVPNRGQLRSVVTPQVKRPLHDQQATQKVKSIKEFPEIFPNESISTESVQNLNDGGAQVPQDPLQISLILKKLFQHFSNLELLQLSLVNKLWNYEARSLMTERGNLMADVTCFDKDLVHIDLEAFAADLRQMKEEGRRVPYSAIYIDIPSEAVPAAGTPAVDSTCEAILSGLPLLKSLVVRLDGNWWRHKDRPLFLLLKKLLQGFSGRLQKLTLGIEEEGKYFIEHFLGDISFPGVKVLELEEYGVDSYIKELVARAPQLQEIHTDCPMELMENVMEGSSGFLMYHYPVHAPFKNISITAIHQLRLKDMTLFCDEPNFNLDRFNEIAPMLLEASCPKILWMDPVLAVPLMCYGIRLENVDRLYLILNYNDLELVQPNTLSIVKYFPFARIFPNLDTVEILDSFQYLDPSPDHINRVIEQANNAGLGEPLPDRARNIKALKLPRESNSTTALEFFGQMFPDIQKLTIDIAEEAAISLRSIWKHWNNLEELTLFGKFLPNTQTLDGILCGIFPEEVAQLREKDEEYLRSVKVAPVVPAIFSFKHLKTFRLHLYGKKDRPSVDEEFSKVARLLALARCPSLDVHLEVEDD